MGGLLLLFYFGGLIQDSLTSSLLNVLLNPEVMQSMDFLVDLTLWGLLAVGATLLIIKAGADINLVIMFGLSGVLLGFAWDFLKVIQSVGSTSPVGGVLVTMVFAPFLLMYAIGISEWWRGVDT